MIELAENVRAIVPRLTRHPVSQGNASGSDPDAFLSRAFSWIDLNMSQFVPRHECWSEAAVVASLNKILDLAIVCRSVYRRQLPPDAAAVAEAAMDRIAGVFSQPSFHDALLRTARLFRYYLWIAVTLLHTGRLDDRTWLNLQGMTEAGYGDLSGPQRSAYDALELRYILELSALERLPLASTRELYEQSVLNATVNPIYVTDQIAYDITHIILFLSDMGAQPVSDLTGAEQARAGQVIDELLGLYACAGNWDLTAELLLCRHALQSPGSALASFAHSGLCQSQLPNGAVAGPAFSPRLACSLAAEHQLAYTFERCHHTTLAAVLCVTGTRESRAHDAALR